MAMSLNTAVAAQVSGPDSIPARLPHSYFMVLNDNTHNIDVDREELMQLNSSRLYIFERNEPEAMEIGRRRMFNEMEFESLRRSPTLAYFFGLYEDQHLPKGKWRS